MGFYRRDAGTETSRISPPRRRDAEVMKELVRYQNLERFVGSVKKNLSASLRLGGTNSLKGIQ